LKSILSRQFPACRLVKRQEQRAKNMKQEGCPITLSPGTYQQNQTMLDNPQNTSHIKTGESWATF